MKKILTLCGLLFVSLMMVSVVSALGYERPCIDTDLCTWTTDLPSFVVSPILPLGSPNIPYCADNGFDLNYNTFWPLNTEATVSCEFDGSKLMDAMLYVSINNDIVECTLNGEPVLSSYVHEGCAPVDPVADGLSEDVYSSVIGGTNTLVCRVEDRGSMSHFDACLIGEYDKEKPVITDITHTSDYPTCSDDVRICANVTDNSALEVVELSWQSVLNPSVSVTTDMINVGGDIYCADVSNVTAQAADAREIEYHIKATDIYGNWDWEPNHFDLSFMYDCADPVADAGGPYFCDEGETSAITLDASNSYDAASGIVEWLWDIDDDGIYGDLSGETVSFPCLDGYNSTTVGLKVVDAAGYDDPSVDTEFDSATVEIANVDPVAVITPASCDEGETITLYADGSSDVAGSADPLTFAWDLKGGSNFTVGTSSISYTCGDGPAKEKVCVQVDDGDTGVDDICIDVDVSNADPTVDAGGPYSCNEGDSVTLTASGSDPAGVDDPLTYVWTILGTEYPGQSIEYDCLDGLDTIDASVTVTDGDGGSANDDTTIGVANLDPTADAGDDQVGIASQICFEGSATDPAGSYDPLTFDWDFGNGQSGSGENPCTSYSETGSYQVTLTVTDGDGGSDTDTVMATIYDYKIDLDKGWNLISFPLVAENDDTKVSTVFGSIADDVEVIWAYMWNGVDKNVWTKHRVNGGFDVNADLKNVVPGYGYYVKMADDAELFLNGEETGFVGEDGDIDSAQPDPVFGMPPSVTLATNSWNLIGKYGFEDYGIEKDLVSLSVAGVDSFASTYYDIIYGEQGHYPGKLRSTHGYWLSMKLVPGESTIEYKANYNFRPNTGNICGPFDQCIV